MSRVETSRSTDGSTIVIHPGAGLAEWATVFSLLPPLAVAVYMMWHFAGVPQGGGQGVIAPAILIFVGFLAAAVVLVATIFAMFWKMYGRETIAVDAVHLRVERVLGPIRTRQVFSISAVSNVRWRERRVAKKHGSYQRRLVSFDANGKTFDLGTYLTLPEATQLERELTAAITACRGIAR